MIDAIRMDESELPNDESTFGTRTKQGTIANRQTQFLKFDKRIPILAAIGLLATLIGWVVNVANTVADVKTTKNDLVAVKVEIAEIKQKEASRDEVDARIDERTKITQDAVNRIEKYLISRGK